MYLHENIGAVPASAPRLASARPPQRLCFSEAKDIHCHCPTTEAITHMEALHGHGTVLLSCNSLMDERLFEVIGKIQSFRRKILLEVHATTALLARWQQKILQLPKDIQLIVIVDKGDIALLKNLQVLDKNVSEYRIIPSQRYGLEFFLRELPSFMQTKITWMFAESSLESGPFLSVDELHVSLSKILQWPLGPLKLSITQPYPDLSSRLLPLSENVAWLSRSPQMLASHHALIKQRLLQIKKRQVISLISSQELKLLKHIEVLRTQKNQKFYWLNHSLIPLDLWNEYISSRHGHLTDHFSWSQFIHENHIEVEWVVIPDTVNSFTVTQFQADCRSRYTRQPDPQFYQDYFVFLGESVFWRSLALRSILAWNSYRERKMYQKLSQKIDLCVRQLADYHFEVTETQHFAKKIVFRSLNNLYWRLHSSYWWLYKCLWKTTQLYWFCVDIFWKLADGFWKLADGFWWLYKHAIAPTLGFLKSLQDYPPEWRELPWSQRAVLRSQLTLKKFGWLALKTLGLK